MPVLQMADGSAMECSIAYGTLRALLFEKTTTAVAGVTRGPGNPSAWLELSGDVLPNNGGRPITITPSGVSALHP